MQKRLKELVTMLNTNLDLGLNETQVRNARVKYGKNLLESKKKQSIITKFFLQFKDVLIIILMVAAVVSIIIDPSEWIESQIIFIVIVVNAFLGIFQENKAEKSLEALKRISSPTCKVLREGQLKTIPSVEVVVGDIVVVEAGDFIPADCKIFECSNLKVDESALTGESLTVNKISGDLDEEPQGLGDMKNCLFSSTYVTNGKAKAVVTEIGMKTEIGKIAGMLMNTQDITTPLQNKLNQVGKVIGIMALGICVIVFFLEMISMGFTAPNALSSFKIAVALAVAAIPEGLATVVTIVLAIGVEKMAKQNAIVKKLPAVETLGSTNVICSDKTGTLTQNRMTVVKVFHTVLRDVTKLTSSEKEMLQYFALCCDASINHVNGKIERLGDPTELALIDVNLAHGLEIKGIKRIFDLPFDSERKLMTVVIEKNSHFIAITKGAVDIIVSKSINQKSFLQQALRVNDEMANNALRVLALGIKVFDKLPLANHLEKDMDFAGLVGMIDPARDEVKGSIALAQQANIRTVMITGDHIVTAKAIANQLGIMQNNGIAITSAELEQISDEFLEEHIEEYSVYARVAPKDKVRIVEAWQKHGAIVAMTGDGVNDAPALKKADIGCAMGITGTDVAKEAADMILTDDNFSTIVSAVKQGRGIYANIQKCVKYLLSSNIGEVLTIFLASLLSTIPMMNSIGVPLSPIHLLWINLITDSLPAFGLGMEELDDDVMKQKPRKGNESFFSNGLGKKIILEGILVGMLTLTAYMIGHFVIKSHITGQTMAFLTLSSCQLFHSYNIKSEHSLFHKKVLKNHFLNMAFIVGFILQIGVIYIPRLNNVFKLEALSISNFIICMVLSFMMVVFMEISKLITRLRKNQSKTISI